ncbi:hypothetical protein [Actinoplanes sp. NPDC049265]|uniref:hypothetical protein n=1 Tax=Actinoplanes sp. NPDC049265 TaxID=3363902 RepID=UPI0037185931
MSGREDRLASYDEIRRRFIEEPQFRIALRADPVATMEAILGELTEDERHWAQGLAFGSKSDYNLVELLRRDPLTAW